MKKFVDYFIDKAEGYFTGYVLEKMMEEKEFNTNKKLLAKLLDFYAEGDKKRNVSQASLSDLLRLGKWYDNIDVRQLQKIYENEIKKGSYPKLGGEFIIDFAKNIRGADLESLKKVKVGFEYKYQKEEYDKIMSSKGAYVITKDRVERLKKAILENYKEGDQITKKHKEIYARAMKDFVIEKKKTNKIGESEMDRTEQLAKKMQKNLIARRNKREQYYAKYTSHFGLKAEDFENTSVFKNKFVTEVFLVQALERIYVFWKEKNKVYMCKTRKYSNYSQYTRVYEDIDNYFEKELKRGKDKRSFYMALDSYFIIPKEIERIALMLDKEFKKFIGESENFFNTNQTETMENKTEKTITSANMRAGALWTGSFGEIEITNISKDNEIGFKFEDFRGILPADEFFKKYSPAEFGEAEAEDFGESDFSDMLKMPYSQHSRDVYGDEDGRSFQIMFDKQHRYGIVIHEAKDKQMRDKIKDLANKFYLQCKSGKIKCDSYKQMVLKFTEILISKKFGRDIESYVKGKVYKKFIGESENFGEGEEGLTYKGKKLKPVKHTKQPDFNKFMQLVDKLPFNKNLNRQESRQKTTKIFILDYG